MNAVKLIAATVIVLSAPALAIAQVQGSVQDDEYVVSQEFIEAEVLQVRSGERTMTVRGETRGQTRQFSVPEGVRVTVNGREARLRDIRRGDTVTLKLAKREQRVVVDRVQVPETTVTLEERRAAPVMAQAETRPATLPKTASQWPLILGFGLIAIVGAGFLRVVRR